MAAGSAGPARRNETLLIRPRARRTNVWLATLAAALVVLSGNGARAAEPSPQAGDKRPRVHVIATGGTIAGRAAGQASLTAAELVASVPGLAEIADLTYEQFASLASDRITPAHWLALAQRVNAVLIEQAGGVVITHGTDTLEETAFFLHLTVRSPRPVVLVGAMRQSTAMSADGPENLREAVRVAASPTARGRGVLVVLNDQIHSARDVTKTSTLRLDAFVSRVFGPLGTIDRGQVSFSRRVERRHTVDSEFDVSGLQPSDLPRVDVAYVYAGADGADIDAHAQRGARGVIMAATGAGGLAPGQRDALARATAKGVVVVIASRTGSGAVPAPAEPFITADDLLPQKARILLMLALTKTADRQAIQRIFSTY